MLVHTVHPESAYNMKKRPLGKIRTFFEHTMEKVQHLLSNLFRQAPCEETFSQKFMPPRFDQQKSCKRQIVCNRTTLTHLLNFINFFPPSPPPHLIHTYKGSITKSKFNNSEVISTQESKPSGETTFMSPHQAH